MSLRERLAALIAREGPIPVGRYMRLCLHDPDEGYYATRPDLGPAGDFITAPLVSQMFGELLGLWAAELWAAMGGPPRVILAEFGPGHGVMMADMLRAARAAPGFRAAAEVWLVETSAPLRARQARTLEGAVAPRWAARLDELPDDAPQILIGNEFLDCLPIEQAVRTAEGWRERRVGLGTDGALSFVFGGAAAAIPAGPAAAPGQVAEWSPDTVAFGEALGARLARAGGGALFIDYGHAAPEAGDTLQALRRHRKEDALAHPGEADLTARVDFAAFLDAVRRGGAVCPPVRPQGDFLRDLGIETRAAALARARPDHAATIGRQLARLIDPEEMGDLFKAAAAVSPGLAAPGFGDPR